jgi:hypothetical protein
MMKQNLLLAVIACACFMLSSALQTEDAVLKDAEGEWILESAEIQERRLNSTDAYSKKTIVATDGIIGGEHFLQAPVWIRFDNPGGQTATLNLNNHATGFDNLRCEWIKEGNGFRLNLRQSSTPKETQQIIASYYGVKLSLGRELTMKFNYAYHTDDNNYVEAICTLYLKKKQS